MNKLQNISYLFAQANYERIETATPVITGNFTQEEAKDLADLISSGALPFDLVSESQEYIGPTIGQQALEVTVKAGLVAPNDEAPTLAIR
jgi:preprotein translocase subunit SecD